MVISPELYNLLRQGHKLAAKLPSLRVGHCRFIIVLGVKSIPSRDPNFDAMPWRFRVSCYELREEFLDEYPCLENLRDYQTEVVGENKLEETITRLAGQTVTLKLASIVDAPY
ncbi:hypothetical protein AWQ21_02550 [Picosynechococcus sp. PCC 7003]|uniref:hypothetical protein n=1 Tax=Picosynechococcus sp. PCC 7003 TaxID=374981 RepID=UPI0008103F6A|nr:hypothetical protein [Picosynechococcus sp. PCC 7003]ANV83355.1 hypothetical protein AWQ21_02550 [Picosynechococcus sp. PCC 7003]